MPNIINFNNIDINVAVGDMIGMHMTLTTPLGSVSGDFLTPMPEYSNIMEIFLDKYLFSKENTDLIKIDIPFEFNYAAKSGNVFHLFMDKDYRVVMVQLISHHLI